MVVEFMSHVGKNGVDVGIIEVHVGNIEADVGNIEADVGISMLQDNFYLIVEKHEWHNTSFF
ncbi:hypothetical protein [Paenisporosarcina sp.]|uniref:hypothetical protein n=1 Tax=Paenisporosarcina sp. TaxID=1932001 RepID=UPI003C753A11